MNTPTLYEVFLILKNLKMTKRVSHPDGGKWLMDAVEAFFKPLKAKAPLPYGSIVFMCGTMVRLDCTEKRHHPINSFTDNVELRNFLKDDYPAHRLPDTSFEETQRENETDIQWSLTKTAHPEECAKAYGCLMHSGYPLPGGEGGDRIVLPFGADSMDSFVYVTIFQHLGACCSTITHWNSDKIASVIPKDSDADIEAVMTHPLILRMVDADSADRRRIDYMFPKPFLFVDKNCQIHKL